MRRHAVAALSVICAALVAACTSAPAARVSPTPSRTTTPSTAPTPTPTPSLSGTVRYVAIGASDTVGVGASDPTTGSWPARIAALLPQGSSFVNLGVSGSLALQAETAQLPGAIAQRPSLVSVWLAVNDLNATIDPSSYADTLGKIVDGLVQKTDATIFVGNVPDLRPVPVYASTDKAALLRGITAYNQAIAAIVSKSPTRVVLVDLFAGSSDVVSNATVAADGFHPSDEGYRLIAERFASVMRARGVPLRS